MKRKHSSFLRTVMKLLCLLLGLVLAGMLTVTAYVIHLQEQMSGAGSGTLPPSDSTGATLLSSLPGAAPPPINILLIGQDRREGEAGNRSDSIILCTFHPADGKLILTSVLRDLYVPIPGHGSNRINAAYAFGGRELLQKTMEQNFDIQIDGIVEVDFSQFSQIIDLLGGVDITLRKDEARLISEETGTNLSAGPQRLNGLQALSYSRIRKLDANGDLSRTSRQRTVLEAIVTAYKNADISTLLKTTIKILPMVTTDMSQGSLIKHAMTLFPKLSEIDMISQRIPADGQFTDQTIDGMSVLVADMDLLKEHLKNAISGNSEEPAQ